MLVRCESEKKQEKKREKTTKTTDNIGLHETTNIKGKKTTKSLVTVT